jgi:hypothetical protein
VYCSTCSSELLLENLSYRTLSDHREKPTDDVYYGRIFIGTMWKRGNKHHAHPIAGSDKEFANLLDAENFLYTTALRIWYVEKP